MVNYNPKSLNNLKRFSSTHRPKNPGRKPSKLKRYMKENSVSKEDVTLMIKSILFSNMTQRDLKDILIDEEKPMIIKLFVKAFLSDFLNGSLRNFEIFMNRIFGAPSVSVQSENKHYSESMAVEMTREERQAMIESYIEKHKSMKKSYQAEQAEQAEQKKQKNTSDDNDKK